MNEKYVIGLDLGTTASKGIVLDAHSYLLTSASHSYRLFSPENTWAIQNPTEIFAGVIEVLKTLATQLPVEAIQGISLDGAMQSLLLLDAKKEPLDYAMTWGDNRAAKQACELRQALQDPAFILRTGVPLQHVYNPARIRWWLEERPEVAHKVAWYTAIKDWILFRLTGRLATDFGLASTTGMLDMRTYTWDNESLRLSGITAERLPELISPNQVAGGLTREIATLTGLPEGLPVVAGSSDGGLANLGSGAILPGQIIVTVGTSGAVREVLDRPKADAQGRTWCYVLMDGRWFRGGAINNGGLTLQWVREKFYPDIAGEQAYTQMNADALSIAPGAEGVYFLPYFTGERSPYWNPEHQAMLLGLTLAHDRRHITRAAMEGVCYCLANIWEVLFAGETSSRDTAFLTGGINRNPVWSQLMADVLGTPFELADAADASAIGAAMLGHFTLGNISSLEAMVKQKEEGPKISFDPQKHAFYQEKHQHFKQLYETILAHQTD